MKAALCALAYAVLFLPTQAEDSLGNGKLLTLRIHPSYGDRFRLAEFSCWIPESETLLRAVIIHQHGCTSATPEKQPPVTLDAHWRALARKHNIAIVSPMYQVSGTCDEWNDPDSGSERALLAALARFSLESGHAELTEVPWLLWGHSGGSSWAAQMLARHPRRVLAASFRGGASKQFGAPEFRDRFIQVAREIPLLFVWGKRESVPSSRHFVSWEPMNTMFSELRTHGGKVGRLIDPESEHGCDNSRLVIIPFFDAVLHDSYSKGVLVDCSSLEQAEFNAASLANPGLAWLPSKAVAYLWREYSQHGTVYPANPQLAAPILAASRIDGDQIKLSWLIEPALDGGVRAIRIQRDYKLWREAGPGPGKLLATFGDGPPEGLRQVSLVDDSRENHTYALTFLDVAGRESPSSQVVRVPAAPQ
jgi:hypothetical protein